MSKRKCSDDSYEYLKSKLKKLEREILRGRRRRTVESCSSPESTPPRRSRTKDRRQHTSHRRRVRTLVTSSDDDNAVEECYSQSAPPREAATPGTPAPDELPTCGSPAARSALRSSVARSALRPPAAPSAPASPAAPSAPGSPAAPSVPGSPAALGAPCPHNTADTLQAAAGGSSDPVVSLSNNETELDAELLEILGVDPTKPTNFGKEIQKDVAIRFEYNVTSGLTKDARKELTDRYLIPSNCTLLDAPSLNPEIKAALSDLIAKRDKAIEIRQKSLATAISALGEAITLLLTSSEKNPALARDLMDAGNILCDCQYNDSLTRRNFILSSLKKDMKDQLSNTKVDRLLFGENFSETLKTARAINKSGAELKTHQPAKPSTSKKSSAPTTSKNWRGPNLARKPTSQTPKWTQATSKTPRYNSSKQWQRRNERSRR